MAAASVSAVLGVLATLLAVGYIRQKELQRAAHVETLRANAAAEEARDAANRSARARDQAEELAEFIIEDLRDELIQINRSDLLEAAAQKAVGYFENLPPELVTPESRFKRASVSLTLSDARYQQGDYVGAIAAARRSVELWKELAASDPAGESSIRFGRALGELGLYQNQSGDYHAAHETYSLMLKHYGNPPPGAKNDGWWDHGVAKAHLGFGEIERLKEDYPAARAEYVRTIQHITAALAHRTNEISWLQMLMTAHNNTGVTFMHEKNWAAAEGCLLRAMEPNRALILIEPKNRRWEKEMGTTLLNLGAMLHQQKDYTRAEPYLREALKVRDGLVAWDSKNTRLMRQLAHAWHRLAIFQFDRNDYASALASGRSALATYRRLLALQPDDEKMLREMGDTARKYRDRLEGKEMAAAGLKLYDETNAFLETQRASDTGAPPTKQK
ncbi:MAG TPA: tetratricopeptide repeat protein [Methylomirabilota bacterium]|nr:tetratricopeptide repeat protein [Methylomirabilota bacterium]